MGIDQFHYADDRPSNRWHVDEDAMAIQGHTFALADGVPVLFQEPYPSPSPGQAAAKIAATILADQVANLSHVDESGIHAAFAAANYQINQLNQKLGIRPETINYPNCQYGSTVAAVACIRGGKLWYGQINDCGVMVLDGRGQVLLDAIYNADLEERWMAPHRQSQGFAPGSLEEHAYFRTNVVNNPDIEFEGKPVGFGVLTGEPVALRFIQTGSIDLPEIFTIVVYTDGFLPFLRDPEFITALLCADRVKLETTINAMTARGGAFQKEKSLIRVKRS